MSACETNVEAESEAECQRSHHPLPPIPITAITAAENRVETWDKKIIEIEAKLKTLEKHREDIHRKLTKATFGKNTMATVTTDMIKHPSRMMSVEEDEGDAVDKSKEAEVEVVEEEEGEAEF